MAGQLHTRMSRFGSTDSQARAAQSDTSMVRIWIRIIYTVESKCEEGICNRFLVKSAGLCVEPQAGSVCGIPRYPVTITSGLALQCQHAMNMRGYFIISNQKATESTDIMIYHIKSWAPQPFQAPQQAPWYVSP